jgi:hypothetical protein
MHAEITRSEMPVGSFRYGQLATHDGVDCGPDEWLVCTSCAKPKNEADNGASGFDKILVVHFRFLDGYEATRCALGLKQVGQVTLVKPDVR